MNVEGWVGRGAEKPSWLESGNAAACAMGGPVEDVAGGGPKGTSSC